MPRPNGNKITKSPTYTIELLSSHVSMEHLKTLIEQFISTLYDTEDNGWKIVSISTCSSTGVTEIAKNGKYSAVILYEVIPELESLAHYEETIEDRIQAAKKEELLTGIECPKCDNVELLFADQMIMLSSPAQRDIICVECGFTSRIIIP